MLESQLILGWRKRGEELGIVKQTRRNLLEVISLLLSDPVPEDLLLAIEGTNDLAILQQWHKAAVIAPSITDLRKTMKQS